MSHLEYEIRLAEEDRAAVERMLTSDPDRETAAFILAGEARVGTCARLLARRIVTIPPTEYRDRTRHHIELAPRAINGLVALCETSGLRPIVCHSHPDEVPYSPSDDHGEHRIAATLQQFFPGQVMGSLLLTPGGLAGRVWLPNGKAVPVSIITTVGPRLRITGTPAFTEGERDAGVEDVHDRQIRAFGQAGQALLRAARVGIVGTGGTGSPLAEQIVRLGVEDLLLVDRDDAIEPSNLSRVYGSAFADVRPRWWQRLLGRGSRTKVEVVARHLRRINPMAHIRAVHGTVTDADTARLLLDRDVIFACTDDHWGRAVLNQLAYQYLVPVVNLGVALDGTDGRIAGAVGVVQVLRPGLGCLWCGGYLNSERIRAESLPSDTREKLEAEGYLRGLPDSAPSVVTITTAVAGLAGTMLLQLLTGFMGEDGDVSRLNYFPLEGIVRRGRVTPKSKCLCTTVKGRGDLHALPVVNRTSP
jgi:molybdopterin/thiamine biosynthesis adenylyltransferase